MADGGSYRSLAVWRKSMDLAVQVYEVTARFPPEERFGLVAQMRRAAVSVPSNIAEGYGRDSQGAFAHFLRIAQGSLKELETQTILAERIGMMSQDDDLILNRSDEIGRMLRGLIRKVSST